MADYRNSLSINFQGKGIPYPGTPIPREDGGQNFGFMNLRSNEFSIDDIPELAADPALRSLILMLNRPDSGFFSIGCASGEVAAEQGFRRSGYFEFAINSDELIQDAQHYFPVFFQFSQMLMSSGFSSQVQFDWILEPASITPQDIDGFSCSVIVNTFFTATPEQALVAWQEACGVLEKHLVHYCTASIGQPLY